MSFDINPAGTVASATGTGTQSAVHAAPPTPLRILVFGVDCSFSPASTSATSLTISNGSSVVWTTLLPAGTTTYSRQFARGLGISSGNNATATLGSGGSSVIGAVNLDSIFL
jgi:hypothetical protein